MKRPDQVFRLMAHADPPPGHASEAVALMPQDLQKLAASAAGCKACPLWRNATQTVFGIGPSHAGLMLVGEQPGDHEDREGIPFVGPAGRLLDECISEAGLDRSSLYLTNAVKHFKWVPSGPRRLHQKPNRAEVKACKPWLEAEVATVQPQVILCLGATAAQSFLGPDFRLTQHRGEFLDGAQGVPLLATIHPSAILRKTDRQERAAERAGLVEDLRLAAGRLVGERQNSP